MNLMSAPPSSISVAIVCRNRWQFPRFQGRVGRPRRDVNLQAVHRLRTEGRNWREVAQAMHVPQRPLVRRYRALPQHNPGLETAG
jgi:hypothetical protein